MRNSLILAATFGIKVRVRMVLLLLMAGVALSIVPVEAGESKPRIELKGKEHVLILPDQIRKALLEFDKNFSVDGLSNFRDSDLESYKFTDRQLPYAVIGDFNGDGKDDVILMGRGISKRYIVAAMSNKDSYIIANVKKPLPKLKDGEKNLSYLTLIKRGAEVSNYMGEEAKKMNTDAVEIVFGETASQTFYFSDGKFVSVITSD